MKLSPDLPAGRVAAFHELVRAALFNASTIHLLTVELVGMPDGADGADAEIDDDVAPDDRCCASQCQTSTTAPQETAPTVATATSAAPAAPATEDHEPEPEVRRRRRRRLAEESPAPVVTEEAPAPASAPVEAAVEDEEMKAYRERAAAAAAVEKVAPPIPTVVSFEDPPPELALSVVGEETAAAVADAEEEAALAASPSNVVEFKPGPGLGIDKPVEELTPDDLRQALRDLRNSCGNEHFQKVLTGIKYAYKFELISDLTDPKVLRSAIAKVRDEASAAELLA